LIAAFYADNTSELPAGEKRKRQEYLRDIAERGALYDPEDSSDDDDDENVHKICKGRKYCFQLELSDASHVGIHDMFAMQLKIFLLRKYDETSVQIIRKLKFPNDSVQIRGYTSLVLSTASERPQKIFTEGRVRNNPTVVPKAASYVWVKSDNDTIQQYWVGQIIHIFTYHSTHRSINESNAEPLLYVQWLNRFDDLGQDATFLPLDLYIPLYKSSLPNLSNFSVISPSSVYCPCFVHTIPGEPWRSPQAILFLNVALTLGPEDFAKEVVVLHTKGHSFMPPLA